ncbi:hypothetical protein ACFYSI_12790 [Staphylococcus xylosus]|uniref:hypothetical protein n=1 Tax=Staphylococcus xylosus TaxID=1288 RepID=UPI0036BD5451
MAIVLATLYILVMTIILFGVFPYLLIVSVYLLHTGVYNNTQTKSEVSMWHMVKNSFKAPLKMRETRLLMYFIQILLLILAVIGLFNFIFEYGL